MLLEELSSVDLAQNSVGIGILTKEKPCLNHRFACINFTDEVLRREEIDSIAGEEN